MSKPTILDFIDHGDDKKNKKIDVKRFLELSYRIAMSSSRAFFKLYELVEKSQDKKLRREAQNLFSHTVVEIASLLHQLDQTVRD